MIHGFKTEAVEKELIRRSKEEDEGAKRKLVKANLKLVVSIAKNYVSQAQSATLLKLIEKGILGLFLTRVVIQWKKQFR